MSVRLRAQLEYVNEELDDARQRHAEIEFALEYSRQQLDDIQQQDAALATLARILDDVHKLEQYDSIQLLWGETCSDDQAEQKRQRLETSLKDYDTRVSTAQQKIRTLLGERIGLDRTIRSLQARQQQLLDELGDEPLKAEDEPELQQLVGSQIVLPWSNRRDDAHRLRIIMVVALIASVVIGLVVPRWDIPEPEQIEYIEIPERLATLVVKKAPPPPPPVQEQPTPEEDAEAVETAEAEPTPEEKETTEARQAAEKTGLLAFKQDFTEIMDASANIKMGSQAALVQGVPQPGRRSAARSLITSQVDFSGTGSTAANVRRTDVIGDDNKLREVEFSRVESLEVAVVDSAQLESNSPAEPRRTDEEIQVVFDRYKDALYRIYSRELRKNSLLRGKLVLELTIEPDGKVSQCVIDSSDLNSEELEKKIVARVLRFNFGSKKGSEPITIRYPINFLPAT